MSKEDISGPYMLFQEILNCPHGDLKNTLTVHKDIRDKDPLFYAKAAAWYMRNGTVRDHKVAFVRTLFDSDATKLRDAGWVLLHRLPAHMVYQVVTAGKAVRSMRSAVKDWMANWDHRRLVTNIIQNGKNLRTIIKYLHIPTDTAKNSNFQTLGKELFTKDQVIRNIFRQLKEETDPRKIVDLLKILPIPAHLAATVIKVRTPEIMKVLIDKMTPNQMLQQMNMLGRMKAIKPNMEAIMEKINKVITDPRVSASRLLKISEKLDPALVPYDVVKAVEDAVTKKAKTMSNIEGQVSIHIDTSGSMYEAIELGRKLATSLSIACKQTPTVFTCSTSPTEVVPKGSTASSWKDAFELLRASGSTPLGAGIALMKHKGRSADTIILITDEGENNPPYFIDEYKTLENKPRIIIVRVSGGTYLSNQLSADKIPYELITVRKVDQYSVDQIVTLVGENSPFKTVLEIMNTDIPERPDSTKVPMYWTKKK